MVITLIVGIDNAVVNDHRSSPLTFAALTFAAETFAA